MTDGRTMPPVTPPAVDEKVMVVKTESSSTELTVDEAMDQNFDLKDLRNGDSSQQQQEDGGGDGARATSTPHGPLHYSTPPRSSVAFNPYSSHSPDRRRRGFNGVSVWMERRRRQSDERIDIQTPRLEGGGGDAYAGQDSDTNSMDPDQELEELALQIRSEIRDTEMLELAMEAEKAAEAGKERFAGRASTFRTEPSKDTYQTKALLKPPLQLRRHSTTGTSLVSTPLLARTRSALPLSGKVPVLALRDANEVIPRLEDIHMHLRTHLARSGVDQQTLVLRPDGESRISPKNDLKPSSVASSVGQSIAFLKNFKIWGPPRKSSRDKSFPGQQSPVLTSASTPQKSASSAKSSEFETSTNSLVDLKDHGLKPRNSVQTIDPGLSPNSLLDQDNEGNENFSLESAESSEVGFMLAEHIHTKSSIKQHQPSPLRVPTGLDLKELDPPPLFRPSMQRNETGFTATWTTATVFSTSSSFEGTPDRTRASNPPVDPAPMTPLAHSEVHEEDMKNDGTSQIQSVDPHSNIFTTPTRLRGIRKADMRFRSASDDQAIRTSPKRNLSLGGRGLVENGSNEVRSSNIDKQRTQAQLPGHVDADESFVLSDCPRNIESTRPINERRFATPNISPRDNEATTTPRKNAVLPTFPHLPHATTRSVSSFSLSKKTRTEKEHEARPAPLTVCPVNNTNCVDPMGELAHASQLERANSQQSPDGESASSQYSSPSWLSQTDRSPNETTDNNNANDKPRSLAVNYQSLELTLSGERHSLHAVIQKPESRDESTVDETRDGRAQEKVHTEEANKKVIPSELKAGVAAQPRGNPNEQVRIHSEIKGTSSRDEFIADALRKRRKRKGAQLLEVAKATQFIADAPTFTEEIEEQNEKQKNGQPRKTYAGVTHPSECLSGAAPQSQDSPLYLCETSRFFVWSPSSAGEYPQTPGQISSERPIVHAVKRDVDRPPKLAKGAANSSEPDILALHLCKTGRCFVWDQSSNNGTGQTTEQDVGEQSKFIAVKLFEVQLHQPTTTSDYVKFDQCNGSSHSSRNHFDEMTPSGTQPGSAVPVGSKDIDSHFASGIEAEGTRDTSPADVANEENEKRLSNSDDMVKSGAELPTAASVMTEDNTGNELDSQSSSFLPYSSISADVMQSASTEDTWTTQVSWGNEGTELIHNNSTIGSVGADSIGLQDRNHCDCLISPVLSVESDTSIRRHDGDSAASKTLRRIASSPSLCRKDLHEKRSVSPLCLSTEESPPNSPRTYSRSRSSISAAMKLFNSFSPRSDKDMHPKSPLSHGDFVRPKENKAFLSNYLYCSKAQQTRPVDAPKPQFCNQPGICDSPDGASCVGVGCGSIAGAIDSALEVFPKPSLFSLKEGTHPERWIDAAVERFDGALESLVGNAQHHQSRWNLKDFQAPSLRAKIPHSPHKSDAASESDALSDKQFQVVYGMSREEFDVLPRSERLKVKQNRAHLLPSNGTRKENGTAGADCNLRRASDSATPPDQEELRASEVIGRALMSQSYSSG